jgi:PAT family beta-lactamase induction signal transducer AmpG
MLGALPQVLAANGVSEPHIASVTAIGMIPSFCAFLLSPILDWHFRRRTYAIVLVLMTGLMIFSAVLRIRQLPELTLFLFLGAVTVTLYYAAIGGWFGNLTAAEDKGRLGAWLTVGNVGSGGLVTIVAPLLLRHLPIGLAASLVSVLILLPVPFLFLFHAPPADARLASESFRAFFRDVLAVLRRRSVQWTLFLFVMPAASFALTNTLPGLGRDFSAPETFLAITAGAGVIIPGIAASLLVPSILRRIVALWLYLLIGSFGALFTLILAGLPRNALIFAIAILGENMFQAAAFAVETTIVLQTIGEDNPLAATQYALLASAPSLPLVYMQAVDGAAYGIGGLIGSYLADALLSLGACGLLALLLKLVRRPEPEPAAATAIATD